MASDFENQPPVIVARGLRKNFAELTAVAGIDFEVFRGQCFGFLGPNGAGKTSTMRMIYCFSPLSGGTLSVFGLGVEDHPREIKARLGVVPQEDLLDSYLTVRENLLLYAHYFDLSRKEAERRSDELLAFFSLTEKQHQKLNELSGGMRRRLLIARALINRPDLLVLDEPTTGLDPQARHLIWQKLRSLKSSGVTMVLTTHYMEEAAQLCDRLVVMDHGKILSEGSPARLIRDHVGLEVVELRGSAGELRSLRERLDGHYRVEGVGDTLYVFLGEGHPEIWNEVPEIKAMDFHRRPASLEDVFLTLTGRELRD